MKQKTLIIGERNRLDLAAQALERVTVNPREQPPFAPFLGIWRAERPAHDGALLFERGERHGDLVRHQAERGR